MVAQTLSVSDYPPADDGGWCLPQNTQERGTRSNRNSICVSYIFGCELAIIFLPVFCFMDMMAYFKSTLPHLDQDVVQNGLTFLTAS